MGLTFPANTAQHLTHVFDLLIQVILRLPEIYDAEVYYGPAPHSISREIATDQLRPHTHCLWDCYLN